jgi:hypothetical protein
MSLTLSDMSMRTVQAFLSRYLPVVERLGR